MNRCVLILGAAVIILCKSQIANAVPITSGNGDELGKRQIERSGMQGHGVLIDATIQTITAAPNWQPDNPHKSGAQWISYADTGYLGSTTATPAWGNDRNTVLQVREILNANAGDHLWLDVWASSTADVQLRYPDGDFSGGPITTLLAPDFSHLTQRETIDYVFTSSGEFYLFFSVFHVGDGPFGLLYSGALGAGPHPDPIAYPRTYPGVPDVPENGATIAMIGFALATLLLARRFLCQAEGVKP